MEPKRPIFNDIKPPKRPMNEVAQSPAAPVSEPQPVTTPELQSPVTPEPQPKKPKRKLWKWLLGLFVVLIIASIAAAVAGYQWYESQLKPVDPAITKKERFIVPEGMTVREVGKALHKKDFIRSEEAFTIYHKLHPSGTLKSGVYLISKSLSTEEIIKKIESGKPDAYSIMFLPGGTITDAKKQLLKAGFKESDINTAFKKRYNYPMMADRPTEANIEGFIYGDTYEYYADSTVEELLARPFNAMQQYITSKKLEAEFKKQGLSLYQGIILASIIQKEVANKDEMAKVSQVFHLRLKKDISLGADATSIYASELLGVTPSVAVESPYNTRVSKGIPPGPISNPGAAALYAAAHPAEGDDMYFVSGDDGITYFSKTIEEHERLTQQHCQKNCQVIQ